MNITLYVNPETGDDQAQGTATEPLKTLTEALKRAQIGGLIQLAMGNYNQEQGEIFPLMIPSGVVVEGDLQSQGEAIVIEGAGDYTSPSFKRQQVAVLMEGDSQLRGVTVTNPVAKGTGIWIESGKPIISNNKLLNCGREGIFVAGKSKPVIRGNQFLHNHTSGIFIAGNGKGEIRSNLFEKTGYGMAISEQASPLVIDNHFRENRLGLHLSRTAKPVLRRNLIAQNSQGGVAIVGESEPDLGSLQDPAGNVFQDNQEVDLRNDTKFTVVSVGNILDGDRIGGQVEFLEAIAPLLKSGNGQFWDLAGHWAEHFGEILFNLGIWSGNLDQSFQPEALMTRAEFAVLIAKGFDLPRRLGSKETEFDDLEPDDAAYQGIQKAVAMGFMAGFVDGNFLPEATLTKVEAIVALVRGLGLKGGNANLLSMYRDRATIPSYALDAIAIATARNLIINYPHPELLNPLAPITRAEVAALIYQALIQVNQVNAVDCPYLVTPKLDLPSFSDINDHWARPLIEKMAYLGLITGNSDGTFEPNSLTNRTQYAQLIVKVFNPLPVRPLTQFLDLTANSEGYLSIQQAYRGGFLSSFPDQTLHPQQNLRRVHVIVSLTEGLGLPAADPENLEIYEDREQIPNYAIAAVAAATQAGIIINHPDPNYLKPSQEITRAEVIAMLYQSLIYQGQITAF